MRRTEPAMALWKKRIENKVVFVKKDEDVNEILGEEVAAPKTIRLPMASINMKTEDGKYTNIGDCWLSHGKTGGFLKCALKADVDLKESQPLYIFIKSTEYKLGFYQRGETVV